MTFGYWHTLICSDLIWSYSLLISGCEFYYDPAGKKKKEEQEKSIASKVGADLTSTDFNQFLKLLQMSGVLGGNSVNNAFQSGLGGGFKQGGRKGGGRRKRPKQGGGRRKRPRKQQFDYYDYDYAEYDAPVARARPPVHASSPNKRPFNQRPRNGGSDREPDFPSIQVSVRSFRMENICFVSQTLNYEFAESSVIFFHTL